MRKVVVLSVLTLFTGVSMIAQSVQSNEKAKVSKDKSQVEIKQVTKIDRAIIKPVQKLERTKVTQGAQPVKKEEEIKSIETNQK